MTERDPEAVFASQARAAYEAANPGRKPWTYLSPGEWGRWNRVVLAVLAVPRNPDPALVRVRDAIAADRCDGESEWASGVNAACRNHLALVENMIATAGAPVAPAPKREVVAYHDKDQPNGIAWCPGYPEELPDIVPLYVGEQTSKNLRGALAPGVSASDSETIEHHTP